MAQQSDLVCTDFSRYFWSEILPLVFIYFHFVWYHFCCLYLTKGLSNTHGLKLLALGSCQNSSLQKVFAALQERSVVARSSYRNLLSAGAPGLPATLTWLSFSLIWAFFLPEGVMSLSVAVWFTYSPASNVLLVSRRSVLSKMQSSAFRYHVRN